jgi:hypothetical protein
MAWVLTACGDTYNRSLISANVRWVNSGSSRSSAVVSEETPTAPPKAGIDLEAQLHVRVQGRNLGAQPLQLGAEAEHRTIASLSDRQELIITCRG